MQHGDGMMSMEMGQLRTATGAAFDKMWLEMMIKAPRRGDRHGPYRVDRRRRRRGQKVGAGDR